MNTFKQQQRQNADQAMTEIELIVCPYDSGKRDWRCGAGPRRILDDALRPALDTASIGFHLTEIEPQSAYPCEASLGFDAQRRIANTAIDARKEGRLPIILGGNCNTAVGGVSGSGEGRMGLVWFDAHSDFCTPETTETGFFDGMGMAMIAGRCWHGMLSTVPGYEPIPEDLMAIVGARGLSVHEARDLDHSEVTQISVEAVRNDGVAGALGDFVARLSDNVDAVYLHIDLDVLDPDIAPANHYNQPNGLTPAEVADAIAFIGGRFKIAGAGFASYDPDVDPAGTTAEVAADLIRVLCAKALVASA